MPDIIFDLFKAVSIRENPELCPWTPKAKVVSPPKVAPKMFEQFDSTNNSENFEGYSGSMPVSKSIDINNGDFSSDSDSKNSDLKGEVRRSIIPGSMSSRHLETSVEKNLHSRDQSADHGKRQTDLTLQKANSEQKINSQSELKYLEGRISFTSSYC